MRGGCFDHSQRFASMRSGDIDTKSSVPGDVAFMVRQSILDVIGIDRPSLLEVGIGTGKLGWPFIVMGDGYVGTDSSFGLLHTVREGSGTLARLIQADYTHLPFRDGIFDAVLLTEVFDRLSDWRRLLIEVCRVVRRDGAIIVGPTLAPENAIAARTRRPRASEFDGGRRYPRSQMMRDDVECWLAANARTSVRFVGAVWHAVGPSRHFIERHRYQLRHSTLPESVRAPALSRLERWATSLPAWPEVASLERYQYDLQMYRFH
jgi:SAM-dependent methyltransferase